MVRTSSSCTRCIILTSLLILVTVISTTEGKCSGKWAIHACWGGNGKRSDLSINEMALNNVKPLRNLLLRNKVAYPYPSEPQGIGRVAASHSTQQQENTGASPLSSAKDDRAKEMTEYLHFPSSSSSFGTLTGLLKMLKTLQRTHENSLP